MPPLLLKLRNFFYAIVVAVVSFWFMRTTVKAQKVEGLEAKIEHMEVKEKADAFRSRPADADKQRILERM